jgi:hypothetical protein
MSNAPDVFSAVDAVRCLYLAKVAERDGHEEAAERLRAKAAIWLNTYFRDGKTHERSPASPPPATPRPEMNHDP